MSYKTLFKICMFLLIIVIEGKLRTRAVGSSSLDFQILLKLGFWASILGLSMLTYRLWIDKLGKLDHFLIVPLFALVSISCFWAPVLAYSLGAAFSVIALTAFVYAASRILEPKELLLSLFWSITAIMFISIIAYYTNPTFGREWIWRGDNRVLGPRMAGIAGPNGIGFLTAIAIMIAIFIDRYGFRPDRKMLAAVFINLIALYLSNSRTPIFAMAIGLGAAFMLKATASRLTVGLLGMAALITIVLTVDLTPLLTLISRSGDAHEIATGTGRVYIWMAVLHLIDMKPLTGWGYASSSFILPNHSVEIGDAPPHAHDMYLQLIFSLGWLGLVLFALAVGIKLYYTLRTRDYFKLTLIVFMLVHGITEASVFQGTVGDSNVLFALLMAMDYRNGNARKKTEEAQEEESTDAALPASPAVVT